MGKALQFFSQNAVNCYNISLNSFFYDFFKNYLCRFYWRKQCSFPHKTLSIATKFFLLGFFPSKIIFVCFFFLILSWQRIQPCNVFCFLLTEKLNHVAKELYLSSQNIVDCYKLFCSIYKFFITNKTFFFRHEILAPSYLQFFYYLSSVG